MFISASKKIAFASVAFSVFAAATITSASAGWTTSASNNTGPGYGGTGQVPVAGQQAQPQAGWPAQQGQQAQQQQGQPGGWTPGPQADAGQPGYGGGQPNYDPSAQAPYGDQQQAQYGDQQQPGYDASAYQQPQPIQAGSWNTTPATVCSLPAPAPAPAPVVKTYSAPATVYVAPRRTVYRDYVPYAPRPAYYPTWKDRTVDYVPSYRPLERYRLPRIGGSYPYPRTDGGYPVGGRGDGGKPWGGRDGGKVWGGNTGIAGGLGTGKVWGGNGGGKPWGGRSDVGYGGNGGRFVGERMGGNGGGRIQGYGGGHFGGGFGGGRFVSR